MKKNIMMAAVAVMVIAMAGVAFAGTTPTDVSVSADIVGTCKVLTTPTFALGTLDQTLAIDKTASANLTFWCTNGTTYTLGDENNSAVGDGAFSGNLVDAALTLPYTIAYTNFTGTGSGKTGVKTSALTLTILNSDYVDATAGNYSDTVTFTINF